METLKNARWEEGLTWVLRDKKVAAPGHSVAWLSQQSQASPAWDAGK